MQLPSSTGEFSDDSFAVLGESSAEPELVSIHHYEAIGSRAATEVLRREGRFGGEPAWNTILVAQHVWASTGARTTAVAISRIEVYFGLASFSAFLVSVGRKRQFGAVRVGQRNDRSAIP